jgi:hypothetical protein
MESDTIASNRSRPVQNSESLSRRENAGKEYDRYWCRGKRIQQKLGTTESLRTALAEAGRLNRDLRHRTEHIDPSRFNKTPEKVIDGYEAILHCAPKTLVYKKPHLIRLRTEFPLRWPRSLSFLTE